MLVFVNSLYPNRIQLALSDGGATLGPLTTSTGVVFDPRTDLAIFLNGMLTTVSTFSYDPGIDQYLIYMEADVPVSGLVQVIYSLAEAPFLYTTGATMPGFALIASVVTGVDLPPASQIGISVPLATNPSYVLTPVSVSPTFNLPIPIGWSSGGFSSTISFFASGDVAFVRIQGSSSVGNGGFGTSFGSFGYPWTSGGGGTYTYDSGMVAITGSFGTVTIPGLTPSQTVGLTVTAYNASEIPIPQGSGLLEIPFDIQVASPVIVYGGDVQWVFAPNTTFQALPYSGAKFLSTTAGSTIVVAVETMYGTSIAPGLVSDDQGNVYTCLGVGWSSDGGGDPEMIEVWICQGIVGGGPLTLTYANPTRNGVTQIIAGEITGVTGIRGNSFNFPSPFGGPSPTTAIGVNAGDLAIMLAAAPVNGGSTDPAWTDSNPSFTKVGASVVPAQGYVSKYLVLSSGSLSDYAENNHNWGITANNALVVLKGFFV